MPSKAPSQNFAFKCGVQGCGKSYPQVEHLRAHGKSHSPAKSTASVNHGKLHSLNVGVNPAFKCGFLGCGKSFYDHEDLLQHGRMTSHASRSTKPFFITTGNKPFKCGVSGCEQRFDDHGALLRHGATHTIRPHETNLLQELPLPSPASPYLPIDHSQTRHTTNDVPTAFNSRAIVNPQYTHMPQVSRVASYFSQPENVDARHSEFNQVTGSQIFIGTLHVGTSPVDPTLRSSSPPPPYQQ